MAGQRCAARQGQHRVASTGCASSSPAASSGFKLHEDWGTTPAAIDACLRVADEFGVQVAIHTDTLNEAGYVESTLAAIAGRTIHTYHTEGAGGGHAPDIITVASQPNVLPSSTNPTRPHTVNTRRRAPRHVDGVPPPQPVDPRGPGVRREPDQADDDRGRGHPPRPRCHLDDRLRLAGDGPHRRGRPAHVADGARDEAAPRRAAGRRCRRQPARPALCREVHDLPGGRPRPRRTRSARSTVGKLADLVLWDAAVLRGAAARS